MTHYGFRADSGGPGQWRGGNGVIREYTLDGEAAVLSLWFERSQTPAWGLFGGSDATPPVVVINPGREDERRMLKCSRVTLRRGDVVRTMTGGGGGFGDPRRARSGGGARRCAQPACDTGRTPAQPTATRASRHEFDERSRRARQPAARGGRGSGTRRGLGHERRVHRLPDGLLGHAARAALRRRRASGRRRGDRRPAPGS